MGRRRIRRAISRVTSRVTNAITRPLSIFSNVISRNSSNSTTIPIPTISTVTVNTPTLSYRSWSGPVTDMATANARNIAIPYIRANDIKVGCFAIQPYSRMYAMFDGVNLSSSCRPLTKDEYNSGARGAAAVGAPLVADILGEVFFRLYVPSGRFLVGSKLIVAADNLNENFVTSTASAIFTAKGNVEIRTPFITWSSSSSTQSGGVDSTVTIPASTLPQCPVGWTLNPATNTCVFVG